jgi:hypothetical protein
MFGCVLVAGLDALDHNRRGDYSTSWAPSTADRSTILGRFSASASTVEAAPRAAIRRKWSWNSARPFSVEPPPFFSAPRIGCCAGAGRRLSSVRKTPSQRKFRIGTGSTVIPAKAGI